MPMELKLSQIIKEAPRWIAAGASVNLLGPPGCGKSQVVEQIVKLMEARTGKPFGFACINASTALPITVPGFPLFSNRNERGTRVTEHTEPVWMTCRNGKSVYDYEWGILLIDERSSAEGDIKKQLADVQLNGRSGNHQLPGFGNGGWVVWSTGNRISDRSGATKEFDFAINRMMNVHVRQDIEDLADHWASCGVHPTTIAFYLQNPQAVIHDSVPEVQGPWCTPRSALLADRVMCQYADPADPNKIQYTPEMMAAMAGYIGEGTANQLATFLKMANSLVQFKDILTDPAKCHLPERPDEQMLVSYMCAGRADVKNIDALVKYISRLPQEFAVMFVRSALKRDQQIINTKALADWCAKNATLMSVVVNLT